MTWYPQDYVSKILMTDLAMRANPARSYPGRTYRFYKGPVVFPFGFGLSYTSFTHSLAQAPTKMMLALKNRIPNTNISTLHTNNAIRVLHTNCDSTPSLSLHIDVTNMGKMDGSHTVLVYSTPPNGAQSTEKHLIGFEKVHVSAGSQQRVRMNLHVCKHLSRADEFGIRRISMGEHIIHIGYDLKHQISVQVDLGN